MTEAPTTPDPPEQPRPTPDRRVLQGLAFLSVVWIATALAWLGPGVPPIDHATVELEVVEEAPERDAPDQTTTTAPPEVDAEPDEEAPEPADDAQGAAGPGNEQGIVIPGGADGPGGASTATGADPDAAALAREVAELLLANLAGGRSSVEEAARTCLSGRLAATFGADDLRAMRDGLAASGLSGLGRATIDRIAPLLEDCVPLRPVLQDMLGGGGAPAQLSSCLAERISGSVTWGDLLALEVDPADTAAGLRFEQALMAALPHCGV